MGEGLGVRASGYRLEIERMQAEEMDYLLHPPLAHEVGFVTSQAAGEPTASSGIVFDFSFLSP
jgi:hypothetical protein